MKTPESPFWKLEDWSFSLLTKSTTQRWWEEAASLRGRLGVGVVVVSSEPLKSSKCKEYPGCNLSRGVFATGDEFPQRPWWTKLQSKVKFPTKYGLKGTDVSSDVTVHHHTVPMEDTLTPSHVYLISLPRGRVTTKHGRILNGHKSLQP